jgi:ATP-dependent Clp protease adapter protein ClpS
VDDLTTTQGIVALAAGGVALIALILAIVLAFKLRGLRRSQSAVLGDGSRDLIAHSAELDSAFLSLREYVEDALQRLLQQSQAAEARIDECIAYRALVRYDAYGEMSGAQSSSVAFLDKHRSGVVVSSIMHRDQARVYVKEVHEGQSSIELSPEEQQAIDTALAGGAQQADAA